MSLRPKKVVETWDKNPCIPGVKGDGANFGLFRKIFLWAVKKERKKKKL